MIDLNNWNCFDNFNNFKTGTMPNRKLSFRMGWNSPKVICAGGLSFFCNSFRDQGAAKLKAIFKPRFVLALCWLYKPTCGGCPVTVSYKDWSLYTCRNTNGRESAQNKKNIHWENLQTDKDGQFAVAYKELWQARLAQPLIKHKAQWHTVSNFFQVHS